MPIRANLVAGVVKAIEVAIGAFQSFTGVEMELVMAIGAVKKAVERSLVMGLSRPAPTGFPDAVRCLPSFLVDDGLLRVAGDQPVFLRNPCMLLRLV